MQWSSLGAVSLTTMTQPVYEPGSTAARPFSSVCTIPMHSPGNCCRAEKKTPLFSLIWHKVNAHLAAHAQHAINYRAGEQLLPARAHGQTQNELRNMAGPGLSDQRAGDIFAADLDGDGPQIFGKARKIGEQIEVCCPSLPGAHTVAQQEGEPLEQRLPAADLDVDGAKGGVQAVGEPPGFPNHL